MSRWDDLPAVDGIPKPKTLRQTALRYADRCPRSAYLYWQHDGGIPSSAMHRGRVFHAVAERAATACVENGEQAIAQHDVKAILDEVLRENPEWPVPAAEMEPLRVMLYHFAEHFRMPPSRPLVEQKFHLDVSGSVVSGTLDLMWVEGDTLFIRDYKSSLGGIPSWDEIAGKDSDGKPKGAKAFQLIVYSLLAADGEAQGSDWKVPAGISQFNVAFVYPYHVYDDGLLERGLVLQRHELIEHRAWIESLVRRVEYGFHTGKWPAVPHHNCFVTCPVQQECPIPAALRGIAGTSPYERDASELAEELLFLQQDVKRLQGSLKGYAEQNGPIEVGSDIELSHMKVGSQRLSKRGKELLAAGEPVPAAEYADTIGTRFGFRPSGKGF